MEDLHVFYPHNGAEAFVGKLQFDKERILMMFEPVIQHWEG